MIYILPIILHGVSFSSQRTKVLVFSDIPTQQNQYVTTNGLQILFVPYFQSSFSRRKPGEYVILQKRAGMGAQFISENTCSTWKGIILLLPRNSTEFNCVLNFPVMQYIGYSPNVNFVYRVFNLSKNKLTNQYAQYQVPTYEVESLTIFCKSVYRVVRLCCPIINLKFSYCCFLFPTIKLCYCSMYIFQLPTSCSEVDYRQVHTEN